MTLTCVSQWRVERSAAGLRGTQCVAGGNTTVEERSERQLLQPRLRSELGGGWEGSLHVCLAEPTGFLPRLLSLLFSGAPEQSSHGLMSGCQILLTSPLLFSQGPVCFCHRHQEGPQPPGFSSYQMWFPLASCS